MDTKEIINDYNYHHLPKDAIKELIDDSQDRYWKDALWESNNKLLTNNKIWFQNKRKGYFYALAATKSKTRALEIGAGTGIVSDIVSGFYKEVVAFENDILFAEFMRMRFKQDGKDNIKVVYGSSNSLPFKDNSFDLIIINGGFGLASNINSLLDQEEWQSALLRHCQEKLNSGGKLIIAADNRFHLNSLQGGTPDGSPPFSSVIPAMLAELIIKKTTNGTPPARLYSSSGYRRILKRAGFNNIELYIIIPDHYNPMIILPLQNGPLVKKVILTSDKLPDGKVKKIIYLLLLKTGILKYLMHSFYIMGSKR